MSSGIHFLDAKGPDGIRLYAIGDVHGRLDLLQRMHSTIQTEIERDQPADWRIIHLGDYVDRGPNSKGVLDFLAEQLRRDARNIALCGNHDAGFLNFLDNPRAHSLFARFGGRETARSYGVDADFSSDAFAQSAANSLREKLPAEHVALLSSPFSVSFGDFFFCHAGIRPGVALEAQTPEDLMWIRDDFLDFPGLHPKIIVHGHTPQPDPELLPNRVNVDTLAYQSGVLTALVIDGADKRILSVGAARGWF